MRRKMMTSLVALILTLVVVVVVFVSSSYNINCHSRDLLLSYSETLTLALNSTVPQALHEASNHALAELPRDRRRRRSVPHEAVLLPDWEALVLLPSGANGGGGEEASCLFSSGAASPARFAGSVPSSGRAAYRCVLPGGVRRLRPFRSPRLVLPGGDGAAGEEPSPEMLRWNRLAYESLSTPDDVVVFAKGVNTRSAPAAAEVRCVYYSVHGGAAPPPPPPPPLAPPRRCSAAPTPRPRPPSKSAPSSASPSRPAPRTRPRSPPWPVTARHAPPRRTVAPRRRGR
uniref:Uncharacterized protein n=1 Tax=Ananas comosus var. bracteatus TaxID=296719 RepID=A0A6V7NRF8_ANACO|nr:unnamed protein product [Ananas comosus var. bracteatus]